MKKKKKNNSLSNIFKYKQVKIIMGCVLILVIGYTIGCIYYHDKFMMQTSINDTNVSNMTLSKAQETLQELYTKQTVTLEFVDNQTETLSNADCGISFNQNNDLKKELEKQNPFLWFVHIFQSTEIKVDNLLLIDEQKLYDALNQLNHLQSDNQVAPVDAKVVYNNNDFSIESEVFGSQINRDKLYDIVSHAFQNNNEKVNVKEQKGYNEPTVTKDDKNLNQLLELAKKHCNASITYKTVDGNVTLDGDDIIKWLSIDEKGEYYYSEEEFKKNATEFVKDLAKKINIKSTAITFKGVNGTRTVSGGNYGYKLKQSQEVEGLLEDIKNQEHKVRSPEVSGVQASYSNGGIGNTYVEIDMTKQHFWYVKNGNVVIESDVVTGLPSDPDRKTPAGVYYVYFMQRNRVLRGQIQPDGKPEYETPVAYWMAFNRGIGLHDATWQSKFGGDVYKTKGSHGCINLPKNIAASLYDQLKVNTPVICYY